MADSRIIQVTLKAVADMSDVSSNIEQIKRGLSGLALPKSLEGQFARVFQSLEGNITKATNQMASGFSTKGAASAFEKTTNLIVKDLTTMSQLMGRIDTSKLNFQVNADALKTINQDIATLQSRLDSIRTEKLGALEAIRNTPPSGAAAWQNFFNAIDRGADGVGDAEKALKVLQQQVNKAVNNAGSVENLNQKWKDYANAVKICENALGLYNGENREVASLEGEITQKINERERAQEDANVNGRKGVEGLITATQKANEEEKNFVKGTQDSAKAQGNLNSELEMFKSRISYFFGMTNAVMLFRRALRSTFETVKDLDKVMTETAVVTEFDVGDMWSQLPEYTERANQLGISIHDAYEAATLYYQQGLSTNEVMAVSNETLKMARIAGLDAAEATDRMTNALRGFNMEITESNAQNINDVYSNLAAKTASNVDEISTAMTKVASLAHNANMSFENTAAFLSQIIETTRESAETAGTALKTVIARFSEVKELYSTGELLGTDEEGEEIDVNKVSKALRTAGINLNEYLTGMKGLDDIFMELSEKWDSLDQVQQRYIATMAAGSRQQSRFIALMQDNARMTELVSYANDAAGASEGQFEKTLESLESKLNQLKNTWNTFLMGIANSDAIKFAVDALTNLFNVLNDITGKLPGMAKSIANIAIIFGALSIGKSIFNGVFSSVGTLIRGESEKIGEESGTAGGTRWGQGFGKGILGNLTAISLALTAVGGILMKFADRLEKTNKASKGFIDFLRNAGRFLTTFGSLAITASLVMNAFGKTVTIVGGQIAIAGKVAESGWLWLAAIVVAGLALYGIVKLITNGINKNSPEKKLERAKKATEEAKEAANHAKTTYEELNDSINSLKDQYSTLESLEEGTKEWRDAVKETNDKVLELIGSYSELGKYVNLENGVLKIDFDSEEVSQYLDNIYKNSVKSSAAVTMAQNTQNLADLDVKRAAIEKESYGREKYIERTFHSSRGGQGTIRDNQYRKNRDKVDVWENHEKERDLLAKALAGNGEAIQKIQDQYKISAELLAEDRQSYVNDFINALNFRQEKIERNQQGTEIARTEVWGTANESAISALTDWGNALVESEKAQEYYNNQILSDAVILSDLANDVKQYAYNYFDDKAMNAIRNQAYSNIEKRMEDPTQLSLLYEDFAKIYGYQNYDEYLADHNYEDVSDQLLLDTMAGSEAIDIATEKINAFSGALESMPPILKRVYEASEGQALTLSDTEKSLEEVYAEIRGIKVEDIDPRGFESWLKSKEGQDYAQAQDFATQRFAEPKNILEQSGIQLSEKDYLANIPSDVLQNFTNQLISVITSSGPDAAKAIATNLEDVLKKVPEDLQDVFLEQLNVMDWNNLEEVEGFTKVLEELNIEINESDPAWQRFIQSIKEGADSVRKFDLKSITDQADNLAKIQKGIRENKDTRSFSEDDYNAMMSVLGSEWADKFVKDEEGNYRFIGGKMDNLADALSQNTSALLEEGTKRVDTKIGVADILKNLDINDNKFTDEDLSKTEKAYGIQKMIQAAIEEGYDISSLGIEGLSNDTTGEDLAKNTETLDSIYTALMQIVEDSENGNLDAEKKQTDVEVAQASARNNTAEQNAAMVNSEQGQVYANELLADAGDVGIDTEILERYTELLQQVDETQKALAADQLVNLINLQKEIELYDLDAEEIKAYADQLMRANEALDPSTAMAVAASNARVQKGYRDLADSYDDWIDLLDESGKINKIVGSEQAKTFKDLKANVKNLLAVSDDLPDSFFESAEHMDLIRQVAEGDEEALASLRQELTNQYYFDVKAEMDTSGFGEEFDAFYNWLSSVDLPSLEAGAYLDDSPFIDSLANMMSQSQSFANAIEAMSDKMGFEVQYETKTFTMPSIGYTEAGKKNGVSTYSPNIDYSNLQTKSIQVPKFVYKGGNPGSSFTPHSSTGSCFVAGTLIATFSGLKPIESIQAGDIVLSYNEQTHQNEYSAVLQTMIHDVTENIYTLHIENDILEVTGIHRFYITRNNKKSWISVQDFQENDLVQFADDTLHRIEKIEVEVRTTRVYNFEVSNNHNYYVGKNQILAHNKGGGGCFAAGTLVTLQGFYKNIEQVSVGDVVLSYNEEKKRNEYSTVVQTMIHLVKEKIYTLYVGRDKLVVTGIHRFYITREEKAFWIPAEELCVGDKVRFADGTLHDITKISTEEKSLIVYNFEVSNTHNYYVGRSQILAHNKGGGGGGGKSDTWENPFDELFNLQEKINGAMRKRNILQSKFNDLLNSSKTTTSDLRKNYDSQLQNLRRQLSLEKSMLNGRKKQLKKAGNEKYEGKSYKSWGVTKYGSFNYDTGELKIDWKALEKLSGKTDKDSVAKGKAAEAYINYLQELADKYNESNDNIREMKEEIREWHKENLNTVTEFEDKVKEAYIEGQEKEIDALEEMFDAIEESTQNVIDGIREQIDLQRQARENDKTEQELADKEVRLAYLQRDTSGANQAEIMSLQKEIDEGRQDYEDTLIDQTIDQMSKDADLAAEQRAQQIEIMRQQLDKAIENGDIWKDVNSLLNGAFKKDGTINKDSKLFQLLRESSDYAGMSKDQKVQFNQETSEELMQAKAALYDTRREQMSKSQQNAVATTILKGTKKNNYYEWGSGKTRKNRLTTVFGSQIANYILDRIDKKKTSNVKNYDNYKYSVWKDKIMKYKMGGLVDFTGPAWLDGTKSKPEMVLNAADSKNLIVLKDVLSSLLSSKSSSNKDNGGDNYFDIDITAELKNDYDVDQLAARIKKQIQQDGQYRNVNAISFLR